MHLKPLHKELNFSERKKKEAAAAAALAAASGEAAGPGQGEEGKTSAEDVKVSLVPTPPQTPKDGSRPSSSRKVITPLAAAIGGEEDTTGGSKPAEATGLLFHHL